jgi:predicted glycoside hydrolase/deacetylase ChbG (UPF0249 family)
VKPARTLIVNADDFGLTEGVSRGILEAHGAGIVTSTTVIVTRPIEDALIESLRASSLGVGLHLNLTLGPPVSNPRRVPSLVDANGVFIRDPAEVGARADKDEARIELGTQIDAFRRLIGRFPTHLDTHHHVGQHPPILDLVLEFARAIKAAVRSQDARVRAAARRLKLRTPDHFVGEAGPEACWTAERVLAELGSLPGGVTEFMTHPGRYDESLSYSRYGEQREAEMAGLTDPRARALIEREGIRLAHFGSF